MTKTYRDNVALVLLNTAGQVFWGQRSCKDGWQFPQGGIETQETAKQALHREVVEEIGITPRSYNIVDQTCGWLYYTLPKPIGNGKFQGQRQVYFLAVFHGEDSLLDNGVAQSLEFCAWRWVPYYYPLKHIVDFKAAVYCDALMQLRYTAILHGV